MQRSIRTGLLLGLFLTALMLVPLALQAGTTGNIIGFVHDPEGAVLKGVTVTATGTNLQGSRTTTTDKKGFYRFTQLPPGEGYRLRFEAPGMRTTERAGIKLSIDATVRLQTVKMQKEEIESLPVEQTAPQQGDPGSSQGAAPQQGDPGSSQGAPSQTAPAAPQAD